MIKYAFISAMLSFLYLENALCTAFGFFGDIKELSENSETNQLSKNKLNFLESPEFDLIYKNLPKTGTTTRNFAYFTANPDFQKTFNPHFKRIQLINCRNLRKPSNQTTCIPELSGLESYSGPAALKLAQSGKKVVVLIFADSTNVGGIYLTTRGNPANTQEEQTVLMAPELYGYLGNNFGVHDIGKNGDGIYSAKQKRYCLNKDDYDNPEIINPAYGFILTNLLMTHDIANSSEMIKLSKDKVVEVSYAFLSMPSFATDVSKDPVGAMLINQGGEKDGDKIYDTMRQALSILLRYKNAGRYVFNTEIMQDIGKIAIFYPANKLQKFAKQHFKKDLDLSEIIAEIIKMKQSHSEQVSDIFKEAQHNYEKCILNKFINLIRGSEIAGADTLILGKIGCGAFLNDENEMAELLGRALTECRSIKHVYFAGLSKTDTFVEKVRAAMKNPEISE